jgi:hypothetical protein
LVVDEIMDQIIDEDSPLKRGGSMRDRNESDGSRKSASADIQAGFGGKATWLAFQNFILLPPWLTDRLISLRTDLNLESVIGEPEAHYGKIEEDSTVTTNGRRSLKNSIGGSQHGSV